MIIKLQAIYQRFILGFERRRAEAALEAARQEASLKVPHLKEELERIIAELQAFNALLD